MNIYYKKIRKKSTTSIFLGIALMIIAIYGIIKSTIGSGASGNDYMGIAVCSLLLLMNLFLLYSDVRSVHILKKNMEQLGVSEEEVARDLADGTDFTLCNVGKRYALRCTDRPDVIVLDGALVVYPNILTTKINGYRNFIYCVFVTEHSGKKKFVEAKDQEEMKKIFGCIRKIVPYAITQNDSTVEKLRKKNLPELIRIVEERKNSCKMQNSDV